MDCRFFEMIDARWAAGARVCVGLDPDLRKIPDAIRNSKRSSSPQFEFNAKIIDATKDLALCYKPNRAFYRGPEGLQALRNTIAHIRNVAMDVPIILDAKYGDIGNTNDGYVEEAFEWLRCDAVTVHNYMGMEAMKPFLDRGDKCIMVLCRTSNQGADEFQNIIVEGAEAFVPMYEHVAYRVSKYWDYNGNCALVVGATAINELFDVRRIVGDMPLLIPGIGTQGGDVRQAVHVGVNSKKSGIILSSSSGIIFADDPKAATKKLADEINVALTKR